MVRVGATLRAPDRSDWVGRRKPWWGRNERYRARMDAQLSGDGFPGIPPLFPLAADPPPRSRRELAATLRRIDGWGPRAWREVLGSWRLASGVLVVEELEAGAEPDDRVNAHVVVDASGLGTPDRTPAGGAATCDWVLRQAWSTLLARPAITASTHQPGAAVAATNACYLEHGGKRLCLRLLLRLPLAGMCCDSPRFARFVRALESFARALAVRRRRPGLDAHRRAVAIQERLRAALPGQGLVAFLGDGSRLARGAAGGPASGCRPLRSPPALRVTIDLGPLGRHRGLGIRHGITAIGGAPYHGKSTLLAAIAAGRRNHPPGDGRERVVADASACLVQAEEERRIKAQDLSLFFARLPRARARAFTTARASGATSMAASVLQARAAGGTLLLVDEDTAASNFLSIDAGMRRLLGRALDGTTTLLEVLPALARAGVSTVLVAGSSLRSLEHANRVLVMEAFEPRDATVATRRLLGRRRPASEALPPTPRFIRDQPDRLLGPRHFLPIDAREPERPVIAGEILDLRRSGWEFDAATARGACAAAAWCCRLASGERMGMQRLAERYRAFIAARGVCGLDPFHTQLLVEPPWQMVVSVMERLSAPDIRSR